MQHLGFGYRTEWNTDSQESVKNAFGLSKVYISFCCIFFIKSKTPISLK